MYRYDEIDRTLVSQRVEQFRDQTRRYLAGELSEDEFRVMRLRNGLYQQRFAPMLRISVPYGLLESAQLRKLAYIVRKYDKGYGHFTTRQNIQLNWPKLEQVPDLLGELAEVQLHGIQACGNDTRNITGDYLAGVAADEHIDPRPYSELLRQYVTLNPEFYWLPRKFKFGFTGAAVDRAATRTNDVAVHLVRRADGAIGYRFFVGGGLGRQPMLGQEMNSFVPESDLLRYACAVLRTFNRFGRRDNIHKARIKIVLREWGIERFRAAIEEEYAKINASVEGEELLLLPEDIERIRGHFTAPAYRPRSEVGVDVAAIAAGDAGFAAWIKRNVRAHRVPGYRVVFVSLKAPDAVPGDCSAEQFEALADISDAYSFGELRSTYDQNLVLADVAERDLFEVWRRLDAFKLATPNIGLVTDIVACPGLDFCGLANAGSIGVSQDIYRRFDTLDAQYEIGAIRITISGCMNGCGHHSVGHIGILGVDKHGEEWYQVTLGGSPGNDAAIGERIGRALARDEIADGVERLIRGYLELRVDEDETFIECYRRIGMAPFKARLYENEAEAVAA
ncbi:MAG TPA: nitrite/sulfite reductase [Steroidobacteraceae bacterium]|jgi:sulfite reductase (NADPH) hemoprotein beta-component|nr:nitrite/sulfite reductase [Steroidobacteraceae bacterium]